MNGVNFKNYAVIGTPTMYILDNKGFILSKMATITEVFDFVKKTLAYFFLIGLKNLPLNVV
jgi:hypothetical protein